MEKISSCLRKEVQSTTSNFLAQLLEIQDVHALEFDNIHFLRSIERWHIFLATFLAVRVQEHKGNIRVRYGTVST